MDQAAFYGQQEFNLPHDVVKLPSKGYFYKPKKESLKIGYLTASDENLLMSQNILNDGLIYNLLKNKIYEPGFDILSLLDVDVQALLIFLRNTSFGSEYEYTLIDPATKKTFDVTITVDEINYIDSIHRPNENGFFSYILPKSKKTVKFRLLNLGDMRELEKIESQYPKGMIAPTITKRLEKNIIDIDGSDNKMEISKFINQMPISDSKDLRRFIKECEPKLDLNKTVIAPSGEKVSFDVTFGVEFFRPFFGL
jgi:hypothetical protein